MAEMFAGCIGMSQLSLNTIIPNLQGLWLALGWLADTPQPHAANNSKSVTFVRDLLTQG